MAISYVVVERGNPANPTEPKKFYGLAKSTGEISLKKLAKEISDSSTTVSDTDVLAVLNEMIKHLSRHLDNGDIVRFGDFGAFQVTLTSIGAETERKFTASNIKAPKITFRPGIDLREMMNNLKYTKVKSSDTSTPSTPGGDGTPEG